MMIDWALLGSFIQGWASGGIPLFWAVLIVRGCVALLQSPGAPKDSR